MTTGKFTGDHWMKIGEALEAEGIDMPNAEVPLFAYEEKTKKIFNVTGMSVEEVNGSNHVYINIEVVR
jgi:hypothetical protein